MTCKIANVATATITTGMTAWLKDAIAVNQKTYFRY
jgi:hypothetical protein